MYTILQVVGLTMTIVLLWHRFTWGFKEWIHEIFFFNFWNGTYVIITGKCIVNRYIFDSFMPNYQSELFKTKFKTSSSSHQKQIIQTPSNAIHKKKFENPWKNKRYRATKFPHLPKRDWAEMGSPFLKIRLPIMQKISNCHMFEWYYRKML